MTKAFQCFDTVKRYPDFQLGPLNFDLEQGTVLGCVGPNGSGKTTTLHCLTGLVRPDGGTVEIFGRWNDPMRGDWKLDIGYVGDEQVFYEGWSGARKGQSCVASLLKASKMPVSLLPIVVFSSL